MSEDCLFCKIIRKEIPADIVEETDDVMIIMDRFPATRGHALVLLKTHRELLTDCEPAEAARLIDGVRRAATAVCSAMGTDAYNILNNNKKLAGQVIPHVHVHIIPRYPDDALKMDFRPKEATDADRAEAAAAIRAKL